VLAAIVAVGLWAGSGFYRINEGEKALVIRFGKFNRLAHPGLNYHLPFPVETTIVEKVSRSRRIEIGYRSTGMVRTSGTSSSSDIKNESIMLTGDENIVQLHVDVTWHIGDLTKYYFNVMDPQETVKAAAESAIREVVGSTPITSILSNQKQAISSRIENLIQAILNQYNSGVELEQVKLLRAEPPEEVISAYRDVQTAKADKEKIINQSESYRNDILPRARGQAAQITEEGKGYKRAIISEANGDVSRFNSIYQQYITEKDVTRSRLYIESVESILRGANKVIIGGEGMLPHMAIAPGLTK
jgi:membrane protease subunit HflK